MNNEAIMERLDFRLPQFRRVSWTGKKAQEKWEPRLARIASAWFNVEWMSIGVERRYCAVLMPQADHPNLNSMPWKDHNLSHIFLHESYKQNTAHSEPTHLEASHGEYTRAIAVGPSAVLGHLKEAWENCDHDAIGALLGYPDCCRRFFNRICVEEHFIDTTWPMTAKTLNLDKDEISAHIDSPFISNVLWRWMGVCAVPHLPCCFDCVDTLHLGKQLLTIGRSNGYTEEMDWIEEILSWPVEWSALHGIAEIKTPVLKISTTTDATPHKYTVQLKGSSYPLEGGSGLSFPYRVPSRAQRAEFQRYRQGTKK